MSDIAIKIENLSKQYRLGTIGTGTLTHDLQRWWAKARGKEDPTLQIGMENKLSEAGGDYVYALKDINLEVKQGEILGVIGKNGAGKSTLLKILSRVTTPTTGTIDMYGRVASLLEVGTGFNPELTGRENIFLNGAIMGMNKREIRSKFEEIVEFSGVGKYIDTPVKRYSSGMYVRLAFAVAAHLEPEILIVDEVLAVGDADFQKKAIGKMQDVSYKEGRTVLFVSHNMGSLQQLCKKGVLLENGKGVFSGSIEETIQKYQNDNAHKTEFIGEDGDEKNLSLLFAQVKPEKEAIFYTSSNIHVSIKVRISKIIPSLVIGFNLYSAFGFPLARADYNDFNSLKTLDVGIYTFNFIIPKETLSNGEYRVTFDITEPNEKCYTSEKSNLVFEVLSGNAHFTENINIKSSIIRTNWLTSFERVR